MKKKVDKAKEIRRVDIYVNGEGKTVKCLSSLDSKDKEYYGVGEVKGITETPYGPQQTSVGIEFLIKAPTLTEAFSKWEDFYNEVVKDMNKQSRQVQIAQPGQIPGDNGKGKRLEFPR